MKIHRKILPLILTLTLSLPATSVQAELLIPPSPFGAGAESGSTQAGIPDSADGGVSQLSSDPTVTAPSTQPSSDPAVAASSTQPSSPDPAVAAPSTQPSSPDPAGGVVSQPSADLSAPAQPSPDPAAAVQPSQSPVVGPGIPAPSGEAAPGPAVPEPAAQEGDSGQPSQPIQEPVVQAEGAVLMDAATGRVLFGKNQDQQFYPASITKVMTALLVLERCSLQDTVTFSATATTNLESGAVALGVSEGDQLTVEQSLYGLLLKSANEIGNGLAEHVAGSNAAFADLMNEKARALGCQNTHFANPHGLNDPNHLTTAYDMALILRAALEHPDFCRIATTTSYDFPALKKEAAKTITMGHKMLYPTDSRYYPGMIGGKTGYTSKAGNTLVTGVERDGIRLIAVVLKSKGTHYTDTKAMLDYGFANYQTLMGEGNR